MKRKSNQFPKDQKLITIDWSFKASNRAEQRNILAAKWLEEEEYIKYRYNVEVCCDGTKIYLLRPTWLNKGFDFQVNVEGFSSQTRKPRKGSAEMPSHKDLGHDLKQKIEAYPELKEGLYHAICDVYDCTEPNSILKNRPELEKIKAGLPMDTLLKIIKWLFIEQDLTYWLHTGRNKLMHGFEKDVFGLDVKLKE